MVVESCFLDRLLTLVSSVIDARQHGGDSSRAPASLWESKMWTIFFCSLYEWHILACLNIFNEDVKCRWQESVVYLRILTNSCALIWRGKWRSETQFCSCVRMQSKPTCSGVLPHFKELCFNFFPCTPFWSCLAKITVLQKWRQWIFNIIHVYSFWYFWMISMF